MSFLPAGTCFWSQRIQMSHASPTAMGGARQSELALQTCGPGGRATPRCIYGRLLRGAVWEPGPDVTGTCPPPLAALVHLPQEDPGASSLPQDPEGLEAGLLGPLPHALAHGPQGTAWVSRAGSRGTGVLGRQQPHTQSPVPGPRLRTGLGSRPSSLLSPFLLQPRGQPSFPRVFGGEAGLRRHAAARVISQGPGTSRFWGATVLRQQARRGLGELISPSGSVPSTGLHRTPRPRHSSLPLAPPQPGWPWCGWHLPLQDAACRSQGSAPQWRRGAETASEGRRPPSAWALCTSFPRVCACARSSCKACARRGFFLD